MDLNKFAVEVHQNAVDHGWWDEPRTFGEIVALCHSELSEALEEYRTGRPLVYFNCWLKGTPCEEQACDFWDKVDGGCVDDSTDKKPEGVAVEMADCIIRILDWCGKEHIDIEKLLNMKHDYNKSRPYRHGGKKL